MPEFRALSRRVGAAVGGEQESASPCPATGRSDCESKIHTVTVLPIGWE